MFNPEINKSLETYIYKYFQEWNITNITYIRNIHNIQDIQKSKCVT